MSLLTRTLFGGLAGLGGAIAMRSFVKGWEMAFANQTEHGPFGLDREADINGALWVWRWLSRRPLPEREAERLGVILHYGLGATGGMQYALLPPSYRTGMGMPYGLAVWLFADLFAVSASGVSDPRRKTLDAHLAAVLAHAVYGAATHALLELAPEKT